MIVIADSTPLIALAGIQRVEILKSLYGRILIPAAVYQEVVLQGRGRPGAEEVLRAVWIETRAASSPAQAHLLPGSLGAGEGEAIMLAQEVSADLVIMDELAGRRELAQRALPMIGTIGVLQQAKLQGIIPTLKPEMDALFRHGFFISQRVYETSLRQVGE